MPHPALCAYSEYSAVKNLWVFCVLNPDILSGLRLNFFFGCGALFWPQIANQKSPALTIVADVSLFVAAIFQSPGRTASRDRCQSEYRTLPRLWRQQQRS